MGYRLNLNTAQKLLELLETVDELKTIPTPWDFRLVDVVEKAEELDNMKQFLKENL